MKSIAEEFIHVRRGRMYLYLRPSHAEALLGIQVQRIGEWLETHYWAREVAFGRSTLALKRPALPDGSGLVIKEYHHGGLLGRLLGNRYFSKRRALNAITAGDTARRAGVPVPLSVLAAAERAFPFGYHLYEASVEVPGAEPLSLALNLGPGLSVRVPRGMRSRRRQVVEASARAVRALHDAGVDHRDLNLANLLATQSGGQVTVYVLDFDSARVGEPLSPAQRLRALRRMYRSAVKLHPQHQPPPPLTQARWLRAYCAGDEELAAYLVKRRASFSRHTRWHQILWRTQSSSRRAA